MFKAYSREKLTARESHPPPSSKELAGALVNQFILRIKLAILAAMSPNITWAVGMSLTVTQKAFITLRNDPFIKEML